MMVKIISREKRVETLILRSESGESYENCGNNNPYRIIFYYTVLTQNLLAIPHTHGYRCVPIRTQGAPLCSSETIDNN